MVQSRLHRAERHLHQRDPAGPPPDRGQDWAAEHGFCPACPADRLPPLPDNTRVGDFRCADCGEPSGPKASQTEGDPAARRRLVYEGRVEVTWEKQDVVEFDAVRMSAIDADGEDIGGYVRGKG